MVPFPIKGIEQTLGRVDRETSVEIVVLGLAFAVTVVVAVSFDWRWFSGDSASRENFIGSDDSR